MTFTIRTNPGGRHARAEAKKRVKGHDVYVRAVFRVKGSDCFDYVYTTVYLTH
jgi:hypothetical protein